MMMDAIHSCGLRTMESVQTLNMFWSVVPRVLLALDARTRDLAFLHLLRIRVLFIFIVIVPITKRCRFNQ